jgi:Mo-co oxidoreductase dimerisation domain
LANFASGLTAAISHRSGDFEFNNATGNGQQNFGVVLKAISRSLRKPIVLGLVAGVLYVPISRMVPRSFITNIKAGDTVRAGAPTLARGIAFGGDAGVARVDFSSDGGKSWQPAQLSKGRRQIQLPAMADQLRPARRRASTC